MVAYIVQLKKKKTLIIKVLSIWQMNCIRKKLPFTEDLLCARHFTYVLSLNFIPHWLVCISLCLFHVKKKKMGKKKEKLGLKFSLQSHTAKEFEPRAPGLQSPVLQRFSKQELQLLYSKLLELGIFLCISNTLSHRLLKLWKIIQKCKHSRMQNLPPRLWFVFRSSLPSSHYTSPFLVWKTPNCWRTKHWWAGV